MKNGSFITLKSFLISTVLSFGGHCVYGAAPVSAVSGQKKLQAIKTLVESIEGHSNFGVSLINAVNKEVIGKAAGCKLAKEQEGRLTSIKVEKAYRYNQYGTQLWQLALEQFRRLGVRKIFILAVPTDSS